MIDLAELKTRLYQDGPDTPLSGIIEAHGFVPCKIGKHYGDMGDF